MILCLRKNVLKPPSDLNFLYWLHKQASSKNSNHVLLCLETGQNISLIPLNYKPLFRLILCLFGLFDFIIESACWFTIGWKCHNDIVSIVMEGNFSEWSEFFRTYFSAKLLAIVLLAVALLFLILYYRPLRNRVRFQVSKYLVLLMLLF